MPTPAKHRELAPKKLPVQARSRETFDALVDACAWLLPRRGYAGTTTNHIAERAGVNIASLYEYFPGKDAIVAQVADRMVQRVLGRLAAGVPDVLRLSPAMRARPWISLVYATVLAEKLLVGAFIEEVPFTRDLPVMRSLGARLVAFSRDLQRATGPTRPDFTAASLQLLVYLVESTIMQLVLAPPRDLAIEHVLDELAARIDEWVRPADS
jgi:AcrR family transcriptional regulator